MEETQKVDLKDIYQQQYAHFGRLNETLYKMPPIFSAIIGGLWYFAATYIKSDRLVSTAVFVFCAVAGCCFIVALKRFELAFTKYIDNINTMDGNMRVTIRDSKWPSTITAIIVLLVVTIVLSLGGAVYSVAHSRSEDAATEASWILPVPWDGPAARLESPYHSGPIA